MSTTTATGKLEQLAEVFTKYVQKNPDKAPLLNNFIGERHGIHSLPAFLESNIEAADKMETLNAALQAIRNGSLVASKGQAAVTGERPDVTAIAVTPPKPPPPQPTPEPKPEPKALKFEIRSVAPVQITGKPETKPEPKEEDPDPEAGDRVRGAKLVALIRSLSEPPIRWPSDNDAIEAAVRPLAETLKLQADTICTMADRIHSLEEKMKSFAKLFA